MYDLAADFILISDCTESSTLFHQSLFYRDITQCKDERFFMQIVPSTLLYWNFFIFIESLRA